MYMEPPQAAALLSWAAAAFPTAAVVVYDPTRPEDAFGQQMLLNLSARGCPLRGISGGASPAAHAARLRAAGWASSSCADMHDVYGRFLEPLARARAERREMLDELEEWVLIQRHYALALGINDAAVRDDLYALRCALLTRDARARGRRRASWVSCRLAMRRRPRQQAPRAEPSARDSHAGHTGGAARAVPSPHTRRRVASRRIPSARLLEHDGAVVEDDDAVLEVRAHRARQHHALQVLPLADHVGHRVAVRDARHVLLDNRPRIQLRRRVVLRQQGARARRRQFACAAARLPAPARCLRARTPQRNAPRWRR